MDVYVPDEVRIWAVETTKILANLRLALESKKYDDVKEEIHKLVATNKALYKAGRSNRCAKANKAAEEIAAIIKSFNYILKPDKALVQVALMAKALQGVYVPTTDDELWAIASQDIDKKGFSLLSPSRPVEF